ncbi:MAG: hypothetical protein RMI90_10530 [Thermoguttaceae bacterium]|nr:hypothetical protein [Thermoguttaceae bacterium]
MPRRYYHCPATACKTRCKKVGWSKETVGLISKPRYLVYRCPYHGYDVYDLKWNFHVFGPDWDLEYIKENLGIEWKRLEE